MSRIQQTALQIPVLSEFRLQDLLHHTDVDIKPVPSLETLIARCLFEGCTRRWQLANVFRYIRICLEELMRLEHYQNISKYLQLCVDLRCSAVGYLRSLYLTETGAKFVNLSPRVDETKSNELLALTGSMAYRYHRKE